MIPGEVSKGHTGVRLRFSQRVSIIFMKSKKRGGKFHKTCVKTRLTASDGCAICQAVRIDVAPNLGKPSFDTTMSLHIRKEKVIQHGLIPYKIRVTIWIFAEA